MAMSDREMALVKGMILRGDDLHHIAALFGINPGRVAETSNGLKPRDVSRVERGRDIDPAPPEDLPPPGPYFLNMVSARDIILDGLEAAEQAVADWVALNPGETARDLQRRYHGAIAERRRELWKGRQR